MIAPRWLLLLSAALWPVSAAWAQVLPAPDAILARMRLVNERFLRAWPDPAADIVTDRARPSNIWTRATYFEGLMALHAVDPDPRYVDYAVRWAQSHNWSLAYGSTTDRNADDQCCGQTYLDLYRLDPRPERIAPIRAAIDNMVNSTKSDDWWWIDALQMAMPVFARLGVLTNDRRYFEKMHALYAHTRSSEGGRGLYNPVEHLWWRDADFDPPYAEPNGANCYWSRGNGWVFAALVRVLDVLPADEPHRAEYVRTFQDMADALAPLQREDGFWNVSLMDPTNYGGRELTGTAFFAYGIAWGIRKGHLSRGTFLPVLEKAWRALGDYAVHADGTLGYVQGSGKQPSDGQPVTYDSVPNFDDFGTGAFLLAGSEVHRLASVPRVDYIGVLKTWRQEETNIASIHYNPFPRFRAIVRGTALEPLFASAPPLIVFPDGNTQFPLTFNRFENAWIFDGAAYAADLNGRYPNGNYSVQIGGQTVAGIRLDTKFPGIGFPGLILPDVDIPTWVADVARPLTIAATPADGPDVRLRIAVDTNDARLQREVDVPGRAERLTLVVPPYSLSPGAQTTTTVEHEYCSYRRTGVDLGSLGSSVTIEALYRDTLTTGLLLLRAPSQSAEKLVNVSSHAYVAPGADLVAGFVVSEGGPKMVLIRAVGPSLGGFGVANPLANPSLRVQNASATRAWQNDDWQAASQALALDGKGGTTLLAGYANARDAATAAAEAGGFPLLPRSRDAALVLVLPPGNYTAQVGASGSGDAGRALVEVYELATTQTNPRLTNLSTRGFVSAAETLTAGFVVTGGAKRVLLRAIGPALAQVGVPAAAALRDPILVVFDSSGRQVARNDNWGEAPDAAELPALRSRLGAFALDAGSKDAEIALTLAPGAYTLRLSSADGASGIVLAEIYTDAPGT